MNANKTYRARDTEDYVARLFASVGALQEDLVGAIVRMAALRKKRRR